MKILSVLIRNLNNEIKQIGDTRYENQNLNVGKNIDISQQMKLDDDKTLKIDVDEFLNLPNEEQQNLNFINLNGKEGGLGGMEVGSEVYLSEMLGFDFYDDSENEIEAENDLFLLTDIQYNFNTKVI